MITYKDLIDISENIDVNINIIEKDFIINNIIKSFTENDYLYSNLSLSSSTSLQKTYFNNFRYCPDIYFSYNNTIDPKIFSDTIETVLSDLLNKERLKIFCSNIDFIPDEENSNKIKIVFSYETLKTNKNSIKKITAYLTKDKFGVFKTCLLNDQYGVLNNDQFKTISIEEIYVNKIKMLTYKNRWEDLYDLWYIIENAKEFNKRLISVYLSSMKINIKKVFDENKKNMLSSDHKNKNINIDFEDIYNSVKINLKGFKI